MVVWFLVLASVLLVGCVCNIAFTRKMWGLFKSWRFKNPDAVEPSELVIWWYRGISAVGAVLIVGVGGYAFLAYRDHARCEDLLPDLKERYATGGIPAVQRRTRELGLELKDETEPYAGSRRLGRIVITDDGKPFATIWTLGPDANCDT